MPGIQAERARLLAEVIRTSFAAVDFPAAHHKTISLGVTEVRENDSADSVVVRVDNALYKAKENGRNQIVVL
jgi:PleD family two-component response regulator